MILALSLKLWKMPWRLISNQLSHVMIITQSPGITHMLTIYQIIFRIICRTAANCRKAHIRRLLLLLCHQLRVDHQCPLGRLQSLSRLPSHHHQPKLHSFSRRLLIYLHVVAIIERTHSMKKKNDVRGQSLQKTISWDLGLVIFVHF